MHIETVVEITATPGQVWEALTRFEDYPTWNPFLRSAHPLGDNRLEIVAGCDGQKPMTFRPRILRMEAPRVLEWLGRLGDIPYLFDGHHYFRLKEVSQGVTRVTHGENFSGILAFILGPFMKSQICSNFEMMNVALKKKCE